MNHFTGRAGLAARPEGRRRCGMVAWTSRRRRRCSVCGTSGAEVAREGRVATTAPTLGRWGGNSARRARCGVDQEVGTMTFLVHGAVRAAGATILSFNAQPLCLI